MLSKRTVLRLSLALPALCCVLACSGDEEETPGNYKQGMCDFVIGISSYAKAKKAGFLIIPQNGQELLTVDGEENGSPHSEYINAIDGVGREDLYYGYNNDDEATPASETSYMVAFLDIAKDNGLSALVTDYCSTAGKMDDSYSKNEAKGYISFAAPSRELDVIPTYPTAPHNSNSENIDSLLAAENFLYLINPDSTFTKKADMINALIQTDYDVLIVDAFFDGRALSTTDVSALKNQPLRTRLVVAYMSIGEAEDYRYYWQTSWATSPPPWLAGENPDWEGNYKVRYWMDEWQNIIYGSSSAYLDTIMSAGFDGVYLDIIDAFEYFE